MEHIISCPTGVINGSLITKDKRHEIFGQVAGGSGSTAPEKFQREKIVEGTGIPCPKTRMRINWRKNEMVEIAHPMCNENGFDYTEDFDGKQEILSKNVWVNLKCIVGTGGSQTRTLRDECYRFVDAQMHYLLKSKSTNDYFANIFDGDEASARMCMFKYLLALPEFTTVRHQVYVGDLMGYFDWIRTSVL